MLKLKFFPRIVLLFFGIIISNYSVLSQCTNASAFGTGIAPTTGTTQISTCSYQSEYSTINSVQAATIYSCNYQLGGVSNGYVTIHQGTPTGPVVGSGPAPLTWTSTIAGTYYSHWNVDASCLTLSSCGVSSITYISPASACTNPIAAGSAVSAPANACPLQNITLSLNGATIASGISYQWQSSADGVTYTDIVGATNSSYVTTQSTTVYYQCVVTCSAGSTSTSTPVQVDMNPFFNCYCTVSNGTGTSACIQNVVFNTISNNTGGCSGAAASNYSSGNGNTNLIPGQAYNIDITCSSTAIVSVWIDFDQNGIYDVTEWFQPYITGTSGILSITVPATATLGTTGMRIRSRSSGNINGAINPCTNFFSGETEDYTVTIANPCNPISIVNPGSQSVCSSYTLPAIAEVTPSGNADLTMNYYDGPNGTGNIVVGPINSTQTIYAYGSSSAGACFDDQIFTITVSSPNTGVDTQFACGPFTWINGVTYATNNNTATHTLTNIAGCDSIVTLNLTVGAPNTGIDVHHSCGPYTWINGTTYTISNNTATFTLTNISGCDSIVTLNLTVASASITANGNTTFCQNQNVVLVSSSTTGNIWSNGPSSPTINVSTSGSYTVTITDVFGCVTTSNPINVIVNPLPTVSAGADQTFCLGSPITLTGSGAQNYTWNNGIVNGQSFSPSSNLNCILTGIDANGCSDTDTMFITVNQPSYYTIIGSAITSFSLNGQTYNQTGIYTQTISNSVGCDSIITLDLSMDYLGLSENEQISFSVFPNPATDILNIQFLGGLTNTSFEIIDLQGRKIQEGNLNSTNSKVDLTEMQAGNYFLKLGVSNKKIQFLKL